MVSVLPVVEVSSTSTLTFWPAMNRVIVSVPSVCASAASVTSTIAAPFASTVTWPVSDPPTTSAALMPVMAYCSTVPAATLVVVRRNCTV